MITSGIETITPAIASELLKLNAGNRAINPKHVGRLASYMQEGAFDLNGDAIRIDDGGMLIDGQHRLSACVKAGVSFQTLVVRGLPSKAFMTIDQGKHRSHADTLSAIGEKQCKDLAAALNLVERYFTGGLQIGRKHVSNAEVIILLERYSDIRSCLSGVAHPKGLIARSVAIACKYLFRQKDPQLADWFFDALISGKNLSDGLPVYVLRERLMRNAMSKAKLNREHIMALTIKAWNATRSNREMKSLWFRENGDNTEAYPVVQ